VIKLGRYRVELIDFIDADSEDEARKVFCKNFIDIEDNCIDVIEVSNLRWKAIDYLIDNHKEAYIDDCLCERDNAHNMTFYEWAEQLVDLEGSDYILNEYNFKRKERG
tara:strand:- start:374 stop:697 length:324 start_codon:yes stop_codon:yes gene_type:complete